jgi:hypothetical protein
VSVTSRLAEATRGMPFSNGTEGDAWMEKWCAYCVHDHGQHGDAADAGCDLIFGAMVGDDWPEAWLPEPDDGRFFLPSRLICGMFKPCTEGACTGDPGAKDRAERVAEVTAYWAEVARG